MSWFWLNVPLMALFFLATAGIPLWLVLRHPETGPARTSRSIRLDSAVRAGHRGGHGRRGPGAHPRVIGG
jgi:hypothetical protein